MTTVSDARILAELRALWQEDVTVGESRLAERLGLGRMALRRALVRLESEGEVERLDWGFDPEFYDVASEDELVWRYVYRYRENVR